MDNATSELFTLATEARDRAALEWERLNVPEALELDARALGFTVAAQMATHLRPAIEAVAA